MRNVILCGMDLLLKATVFFSLTILGQFSSAKSPEPNEIFVRLYAQPASLDWNLSYATSTEFILQSLIPTPLHIYLIFPSHKVLHIGLTKSSMTDWLKPPWPLETSTA